MIITLKGDNFSANNIGTLSTWTILRVLGDGATYSGSTYVDKGTALNATVTIADGYELGSAGVSVTMGGNPVTSGVTTSGSTITINIASVTGNVVIKVPTVIVGGEGSGGGIVKVERIAQEEKAVPNTGFVDFLRFNTSLSINETLDFITNANLTWIDYEGIPMYPLLTTEDGKAFAIIDYGAAYGTSGYYIIMENASGTYYFSFQNGWIEEALKIEINSNALPDYSGIPVGLQNDVLFDLVKCGENVEGYYKELSGTYEPIELNIDKNSNIDLSTYMDNKQMPIKANVNTPNTLKNLLDTTKTADYMFNYLPGITTETIETLLDYNDTENVTRASYMFANTKITRQPNLNLANVQYASYMFNHCENLESVEYDFSHLTAANGMFFYTTSLKKIGNITVTGTTINSMFYGSGIEEIKTLDTSNVYNFSQAFYDCKNLTTIENVSFRMCKLYKSLSYVNNVFYGCTNLTNLKIFKICNKLQISDGSTWGHLLTLESLLHTIQELVTGEALNLIGNILTIGSANLEKLTNVYVKLTNEPEEDENYPILPFEVCESTDEGAMTINEYVTLKGWEIA